MFSQMDNTKYKTGKTRYKNMKIMMEKEIEKVIKEIPHPPKEVWPKQIYWIIFLWIQQTDFPIPRSQFQITEKQDLILNSF